MLVFTIPEHPTYSIYNSNILPIPQPMLLNNMCEQSIKVTLIRLWKHRALQQFCQFHFAFHLEPGIEQQSLVESANTPY